MFKRFVARAFALILVLCPFSALAEPPERVDGISGSVLSGDSPSVVFLNTDTGAGYWTYPRNQWVAVDLKPFGAPSDAIAALIHGLLIITMPDGSVNDASLVAVHFRRPGSVAQCANSTAYTDSWKLPSGSLRVPFSDFVPLADGVMEVCIQTKWGSPGGKPAIPLAPWEASFNSTPSFGVNVRLRGWLK